LLLDLLRQPRNRRLDLILDLNLRDGAPIKPVPANSPQRAPAGPSTSQEKRGR
jgi:hypothetical protein